MKTDRRHELRTNDLSAFFVDANEWIKKRAATVSVVVVVVAVLFLVFAFVRRSRVSSTDAAWQTMRQLSFTLDEAEASFITLDRLIDEAKDPDFRMTALLNKGKSSLALATLQAEGFRPEFLDGAQEAYQTLLEAYPDCMPVLATALGGLASVEENRFVTDADLTHRDAARSYLEKLQNDTRFRGTPFQTEAARRLLTLDETFQVITMAEPLALPPAPPPVTTGPTLETITVESTSGAPIRLKIGGQGSKPGEPELQNQESDPSEPDDAASPPESEDASAGESRTESEAASKDDSASQQEDSKTPSPAPPDDSDGQ